MQIANSFEQQQPSADLGRAVAGTATEMRFWIQEALFGTGRRSVIHLGECPLCQEGQKRSTQDRWYGPFESITSARQISDQLPDLAMRAECRCVRKVVTQDLPVLALLNEPLFRKPASITEQRAKKRREEQLADTPDKRNPAKSKSSHLLRYAAAGAAAILITVAALFIFPAVSVVEASTRQGSSSFLLTNSGWLDLKDVNVECTMELPAASVKLSDTHVQVAEKLNTKTQAMIPCFQRSGTVPQTSGITMQLVVNYAVLGVQHTKQRFTFVASPAANGYCRWVLKD